MRKFLQFLKSREFWFSIAGAMTFFVLLFILFFFIFLPWYTRHGQAVRVPDVTKLKIDQAQTQLEEAGLRYSVDDSLYSPLLPPLSVISQDPLPGDSAKPGRIVHLTVNKAIPPMVKLPKILGVSHYQAKLRLEGQGLKLGNLKMVPHEYADLVLRAYVKGRLIEEGDSIPKGTIVDLEVGQGKGDEKVAIPDLIGMDMATAIATLQRLGLNVAEPQFEAGAPQPHGVVIIQSPKFSPTDSLQMGQEVTLIISGPQPKESMDDPVEGPTN